MDIVDRLTSELMKLRDSDESPQSDPSLTERYKTAARNYASMENTVSVLSDLKSNVSHIYYGRFAETLGIGNRPAGEETIDSIWERRIMELIQPNDLHDKHLNELRFFHFIRHLPKSRRADYYLVNKLRMRNRFGNIVPAVHRLFYISDPANNGLWFALCLYGPMTFGNRADHQAWRRQCHKNIDKTRNGGTEDDKPRHDKQTDRRGLVDQHKHCQQAQAGDSGQTPGTELHRSMPRSGRPRSFISRCRT